MCLPCKNKPAQGYYTATGWLNESCPYACPSGFPPMEVNPDCPLEQKLESKVPTLGCVSKEGCKFIHLMNRIEQVWIVAIHYYLWIDIRYWSIDMNSRNSFGMIEIPMKRKKIDWMNPLDRIFGSANCLRWWSLELLLCLLRWCRDPLGEDVETSPRHFSWNFPFRSVSHSSPFLREPSIFHGK